MAKIIQKKPVTVNLPVVNVPKPLRGFVAFVREQGVVGLAVGLTLGLAAKSLVDSMVANIFSPIVGFLTGGVVLSKRVACLNSVDGICTVPLRWGQVLSDVIGFLIIAFLVYALVHGLKLDKLDKKKDK